MSKPLSGEKIAVLVANGFNESELIAMQRMAQSLGAGMSVVAVNNGLVNSWNGTGWGLNFAVDKVLNEALAVDYTMLVVPGGRKSADKLMQTAHTKRFVGGFMNAQKPVVALGEALDLVTFAEQMEGRTVCASGEMADAVMRAAGKVVDDSYAIDGMLMSAPGLGEGNALMVQVESFLLADSPMDQAA